jgi:O-glycosyl hydrolase
MVVLLVNANCGEAAPEQAIIKINPQQKFQIMTGWEATAQAGESYSPAFDKYKEELFNNAVNDLGINRLRLEVRSGAENPKDFFTVFDSKQISEDEFRAHYYEVINDNDDPFLINPRGFHFSELDSTIERIVLPMRKLLAERGESLFLNLNYLDFKGNWRGNSNIRHNQNAEEYAEFILTVYQHMQGKYGFVPDAVEVILEPDSNAGWSGAEIGKVIVATVNRLLANKFKPAFITPSTTNAANAPIYIDEIANVPNAMKYISEFSYHRYCCASDEVLQRIAERGAKYGKQTAMLEWIGADYKTLHEDLKLGGNSAWQQFTLAFPNEPDNGAQYYQIDDKNPQSPTVTLGNRTKFLRQYFRYIRSGSQRIDANTSNPNFDPLAFVNSDGKIVLVVKSEVSGTVTVKGLPVGVYGVSYTTSKETDSSSSDISYKERELFTVNIPAAGVITIFAKNSAAQKH